MKTYTLRGVKFLARPLPRNAFQLQFRVETNAELQLAVSFADDLGACDYASAPGVFVCTVTADTMTHQLPWRLDRFNLERPVK